MSGTTLGVSEVERVEGAVQVGRTEGRLAGEQGGAGKERVGVMETIVMPEAGTGGSGKVPCLVGRGGGGKGKEVGIETV